MEHLTAARVVTDWLLPASSRSVFRCWFDALFFKLG
jgi:hypothetical protein